MRVYISFSFLIEFPVEISLVCLNVYVYHLLVYVNIPYMSGTHCLVLGESPSAGVMDLGGVECQAPLCVCRV